MVEPEKPSSTNKLNLAIDLRVVVLLLVAIIVAMIVIWKPWDSAPNSERTVTVTGEAKITAEPDEFVFYPMYNFKNADKDAALKELTAKSDTIVAKLKELGVQDKNIKTDSNGNDYSVYYPDDKVEPSYQLSLTVTVKSREEAQKIQDYLVTTSPLGTISPQASFSDGKRKELENKARDDATKEARAKADQSAKNLGFRVGAVKSIEDGAGFGEVYPLLKEGAAAQDVAVSTRNGLGVNPGENDLHYSVTVVYFVR